MGKAEFLEIYAEKNAQMEHLLIKQLMFVHSIVILVAQLALQQKIMKHVLNVNQL